MKSVRNLFMAGCAGILALASCSSDDSGDVIGRNPIRFNSGIETRAVDQTWGNDAIGVYMIENGSTLSATSIVDGAANKKFTTAGTGDFVHATQSDQIRFPESGSVDFIAYYPYRQTITDYKYPIDVSDQTESADIDFMYAKADGYSKSSSSVTLTFKHSLSAIRLSIEDQEGNSLSGMTVALEGLNTEAEYSLVDKSITNLSNIADIETVVSNVSGAAAQADAILIPASGLSGVNLKIYVPSSGMEYNEDFNYELKAETRHLYAIVLKGDGTVTLQPTGNIDGWDTEDNTGNPIEIDPDGAEAGTKANPYGVGDLDASLVGETVWVEGYIVGAEESGALVTSGISTQSNIVIAASAGETNLANCVLVDISTDTDVEGALNLVDNDDLLGQSVKVLGTVAAGGTTAYALNNVTDQEGGNEPGSGGAELQFLDTFGPAWREGTSG
ncbi:MAG: fimbrillin family protein, partial [Rikenellaceae bacterium]|nr:fimbrillin family protein [Rikenellaceae bacterium]